MEVDDLSFYKLIPAILKDIKEKDDNLEIGAMTLNIGLGDKRKDVKVLLMPDYVGILDDNDDLRYVFGDTNEIVDVNESVE